MGARGIGLASMALACGCAFVSGLSNLEVTDASSSADAASEAPADVGVSADAPPLVEAGGGGYALSASGGCASGLSSFSLSNIEFSITLWLRVDATALSDFDMLPILWNGGRSKSEPGWSLDLTTKGITFCVADQNGSTCTPAAPIAQSHLVHIGIVSPYTGVTSGRSLQVYAMDLTAKETTHTQVALATGAQGNWTSSAPFTIGGAQVASACTTPSSVTVDRVHLIQNTLLTVSQLDSSAAQAICGSSNSALADFELDEGSGNSTTDCIGKTVTLGWAATSKIAFVISPFP